VITTPSGLVVPASAVAKRQRTLAPGAFKKMRRFVREMKDEGIGALLACPACKTQLELVLEGTIRSDRPGGVPVLRCGCTEWRAL
jgi:hypothetical protein